MICYIQPTEGTYFYHNQATAIVPLHVLHVFKLYLPDLHGGIQEVIRQLCHTTSLRYGVENRVLTVAQGPGAREIELADSTVVRCRLTLDAASTPISIDMVGEFRRQLAWADIVHYHFPWPFAEGLHLLYGKKTRSVVTYHSDIYKQRFLKVLYGPIMHAFLHRVGRIIVTSGNYLATSSDLASHRDQCTVIPIGLDELSYAPVAADSLAAWERRLGRGFFLFVGILRYYKGLHILLEASRHAPFKVVIAGTGPLEKELQQKAAALGLDERPLRRVYCRPGQDGPFPARPGGCLSIPVPVRSVRGFAAGRGHVRTASGVHRDRHRHNLGQ